MKKPATVGDVIFWAWIIISIVAPLIEVRILAICMALFCFAVKYLLTNMPKLKKKRVKMWAILLDHYRDGLIPLHVDVWKTNCETELRMLRKQFRKFQSSPEFIVVPCEITYSIPEKIIKKR